MQYKVEIFPTQNIAYMRRVGAYGSGNNNLMERFKGWMREKGYHNGETVIYAVARDNPETTSPKSCRYDVGMVVEKGFTDDDVEITQIEQGKYLVFQVPHTAEAVREFYSLFFTLIGDKEYTMDIARPILERYNVSLVESGYCEFCVPII